MMACVKAQMLDDVRRASEQKCGLITLKPVIVVVQQVAEPRVGHLGEIKQNDKNKIDMTCAEPQIIQNDVQRASKQTYCLVIIALKL